MKTQLHLAVHGYTTWMWFNDFCSFLFFHFLSLFLVIFQGKVIRKLLFLCASSKKIINHPQFVIFSVFILFLLNLSRLIFLFYTTRLLLNFQSIKKLSFIIWIFSVRSPLHQMMILHSFWHLLWKCQTNIIFSL